jgi:predicted transcriptional regulator
MSEITLKEYCKEYSQTQAAKLMGKSCAAVSQMLAKGRDVWVVTNEQGQVSFYERRELKIKPPKEVPAEEANLSF